MRALSFGALARKGHDHDRPSLPPRTSICKSRRRSFAYSADPVCSVLDFRRPGRVGDGVKKKTGQLDSERRQRFILGKLAGLSDMSMLEIGFSATPQALRSMAASGLVRVRVEITQRGRERLQSLNAKAQRREWAEAKKAMGAA